MTRFPRVRVAAYFGRGENCFQKAGRLYLVGKPNILHNPVGCHIYVTSSSQLEAAATKGKPTDILSFTKQRLAPRRRIAPHPDQFIVTAAGEHATSRGAPSHTIYVPGVRIFRLRPSGGLKDIDEP